MDITTKITWNPYSEGYFDNPYPHLAECRENNPVHVGLHGAWMLFRHKDVSSALKSPELIVSDLNGYFRQKEDYIFRGSDQCPYLADASKYWLTYLNGDIQKKLRVLWGKIFQTIDLEQLISSSLDQLEEKYSNTQQIDVVEYCDEFIYNIVIGLLNVPESVPLDEVKKFSNLVASSADLYVPKQRYLEANAYLLRAREWFSDSEILEKVHSYAKELKLDLNQDGVYSTLFFMLFAAFETSKDNLSLALYEILKRPHFVSSVLDQSPKEQNMLIEELFRLSSPLQYTIRVNQDPLFYDGIEIPAQSKIYFSIASANRDPSVFNNPDEIVVDRKPNPHLSFGAGSHFCLGANIARQELRICLKPMIRFLAQHADPESMSVAWSKQIFMRTPTKILIKS